MLICFFPAKLFFPSHSGPFRFGLISKISPKKSFGLKPCLHWWRFHNNAGDNDSDSYMKQYLPWPHWVTRQKIETILSVLGHPRWHRQGLCHVATVAVTDSFAYKLHQSKWSIENERPAVSMLKKCKNNLALVSKLIFNF